MPSQLLHVGLLLQVIDHGIICSQEHVVMLPYLDFSQDQKLCDQMSILVSSDDLEDFCVTLVIRR